MGLHVFDYLFVLVICIRSGGLARKKNIDKDDNGIKKLQYIPFRSLPKWWKGKVVPFHNKISKQWYGIFIPFSSIQLCFVPFHSIPLPPIQTYPESFLRFLCLDFSVLEDFLSFPSCIFPMFYLLNFVFPTKTYIYLYYNTIFYF